MSAEELEAQVANLGENASFADIEALLEKQSGADAAATTDASAKAQAEAEAAVAAEAAAAEAAKSTSTETPVETPVAAAAATTVAETQSTGATASPAQSDDGAGAIVGQDGKTLIPHGVLAGTRRELAQAKQRIQEFEQQAAAEREARERAETEAATLREQLAGRKATGQDVKDVQGQADAAGITDATGKAVNVLTIDTKKLREEYDGPIVDVIEALQTAVNTSNAELQVLKDRDNARTRQAQVAQADTVQTDIDRVPALADWQVNNPAKWAAAVAMDQALMKDPTWQDKPRAERFAHVAKELGGAVAAPTAKQTPASAAAAPAAGKTTVEDALKAARPAIPLSHSDLPAGQAAAQSETELLDNMSPEQLSDFYAKLGPDKVNELLAKIG